MAMMASGSGSGNPSHYDPYDNDADLIDPDDATLDDLDPMSQSTSDRAPLTGSIQPQNQQRIQQSQSYLNDAISGEDRRAPSNTIDETVWATLQRDLIAVWEKMRQVLYPKYLLGGVMKSGEGIGGAEREEGGPLGSGVGGAVRGLVGRWPSDLPGVLLQQGGMSEGLRDWDLWGPLLFCLLLSFFLSRGAKDEQKSLVFSGVFTMVWLGEAVVTLQIKLLGGNISFFQSVCIIGYTLFPLVIASILSAVGLTMIARIPVYIVLALWSVAAGISILGGSGVVKDRVFLAMFPLFLFYLALTALCFIS